MISAVNTYIRLKNNATTAFSSKTCASVLFFNKMCTGLLLIIVLLNAGTCFSGYVGAGACYVLKTVQDVWLEDPNNNNYGRQWLIVSKATGFSKKRSLIQFEDIPNSCQTVNHAMMYLYYDTSAKASWQTNDQAPFITRTIQAHRVLQEWDETQATTTKRTSTSLWNTPYLGLDDIDARSCPTGHTTIYAVRPQSFVEIEITSAAKEWKAGDANYGVVIWATNEDQNGRDTRFASTSDSDPSKHPYVVLNCD